MKMATLTFPPLAHHVPPWIRRDTRTSITSWSRFSVVAATAVLLASCGGGGGGGNSSPALFPSATGTAQAACNSFLNQAFEGATITQATLTPKTDTAPETCTVRGEMPPELAFEVRMPSSWNQRVLFMGGGGFDGAIYSSAYSPGVAESGYATIATNHGHEATKHPNGSFAMGPRLLQDYADGAVPQVLASAKAVLRSR